MSIALRIEECGDLPHQLSSDELQLAAAFLEAIIAERRRAHAKHGATSMEQAPTFDPWRGLILGEEALECGKALNDHRHGAIALIVDEAAMAQYGGGKVVVDELDKELIQTATMAYTWWANRRGHQLPAPEPERCQWIHEGRVCGMPRNAHSRTRTGGYLVGHAFVEESEVPDV